MHRLIGPVTKSSCHFWDSWNSCTKIPQRIFKESWKSPGLIHFRNWFLFNRILDSSIWQANVQNVNHFDWIHYFLIQSNHFFFKLHSHFNCISITLRFQSFKTWNYKRQTAILLRFVHRNIFELRGGSFKILQKHLMANVSYLTLTLGLAKTLITLKWC